MEEIGYRTSAFSFDGIAGQQREYVTWVLKACAAEGTAAGDLITISAATRLEPKLTRHGYNGDRPELKAALEYMRPGDTLVVWRLSRLARSLKG